MPHTSIQITSLVVLFPSTLYLNLKADEGANENIPHGLVAIGLLAGSLEQQCPSISPTLAVGASMTLLMLIFSSGLTIPINIPKH